MGSRPQTRGHLKDLMNVDEVERMNGMKSFHKICSKLLENLDNEKYHSLNYEAVCKKFAKVIAKVLQSF